MLEGLVSVAVLGLQLLGLALLALSQSVHWYRVMTPRPFPGTRSLRVAALLVSGLAWWVSQADLGSILPHLSQFDSSVHDLGFRKA